MREDQFKFIENYLKLVPADELVVLSMHIPLFQRRTSYYEGIETFRKADRERLFRLLKNHPHTLSLSAHTHLQMQHFFKADEGWLQEKPHHHFNRRHPAATFSRACRPTTDFRMRRCETAHPTATRRSRSRQTNIG